MGFLDTFKPQPAPPVVPSLLPDAAKQQILSGRLPNLKPANLFLKANERCHYVDRAIYEKKIIKKRRVSRNAGYSAPGLFKGTRVHFGGGASDYVDDVSYETIKGILYITSQRIIFVGESEGFDKKLDDLVAITPYSNGVEFQFSRQNYKLFVPDGLIVQQLPHIVH